MQLVLSGKRVLTHGDNFLPMGGTVINLDTGAVYQNATVAECDGCPSDIDKVGYEYHAGQFIPCAPYGVGNGNVAVVCNDDCKAIKDSGISVFTMGCATKTSYTGTGTFGSTNPCVLTFDFAPSVVFIKARDMAPDGSYLSKVYGFIYDNYFSIFDIYHEHERGNATITGNTVKWYDTGATAQLNISGVVYDVFAIGLKEA